MSETRAPKSKEEILAQMKSNVVFQKKMAFAREKFYPALLKANPTVEEATMWLEGFNSALMQEFLAKMKEVKMSELKLGLKLNAMDDKFVEFQEIISLFDEMTVFDAKDNIEGMKGEIHLWKSDEDRSRRLSELKTKWADEL